MARGKFPWEVEKEQLPPQPPVAPAPQIDEALIRRLLAGQVKPPEMPIATARVTPTTMPTPEVREMARLASVRQQLKTPEGMLTELYESLGITPELQSQLTQQGERLIPFQTKERERRIKIEGEPVSLYKKIEAYPIAAANTPLFEIGGVGVSAADLTALGLIAFGAYSGARALPQLFKGVGDKALKTALNTGLDKWIAQRSRGVPAERFKTLQDVLYNQIVKNKTWLQQRATENMLNRMGRGVNATKAATEAVDEALQTFENKLLPTITVSNTAVLGQRFNLSEVIAGLRSVKAPTVQAVQAVRGELPRAPTPKAPVPAVTVPVPAKVGVTPEVTLYRGEPIGIRPTVGGLVPFTPDIEVAREWAGKVGRVVQITLRREEFDKLQFQKLPDRIATYFVPQDIYNKAIIIPKAEPGMPEAGLQPSMIEGVAPEVVRPVGKGRVTQVSMDEQLKLEQAKLAGLRETIATAPAADYTYLVKTSGKNEGEIPYLTKAQFKKLYGEEPKASALGTYKETTVAKAHTTKEGKYVPERQYETSREIVRWEYALDQKATELGYADGEAFRQAIMDVYAAKQRIAGFEETAATVAEAGPAEFAVAWDKPKPVTLSTQLTEIYDDIKATVDATRAALKGMKGEEAAAGRQATKLLDKELAGIKNLQAVKADPKDIKSLRQQINAVASFKGLPKTQLTEVKKKTTGQSNLMQMTKEQLNEVLKAVQSARPRKIKGVTVLKSQTERNIQSLKASLVDQKKMSEEAYRKIMRYLRLPTDRYVSSRLFISESDARGLIRQMNYEAEVGLIEHEVKLQQALQSNESMRKEIEALKSSLAKDDPSITRNIGDLFRRLTGKPMPAGADVSGLWSARYRFEKLGLRTDDIRWHQLERLITEQAKVNEYVAKTKLAKIQQSSEYKRLAGNQDALKRVSDYIASKNKMGPEAPKNITEAEKKLADAIEKHLFSYRNEVRYDRFKAWYDTHNGNVDRIMANIKDAPREDIRQAIRIYESKGDKALREFLDTKEWGVIKSGYEPHIAINPRLVDYKISEAVIGKGRLKSREGLDFTDQDRDILSRTVAYTHYMEKLKLRPYLVELSRVYAENVPKLTDPQKIKVQLEGFMSEAKGGRTIEHPVMKVMAKVAAMGYQTIFKFPHLFFRNLFQSDAFVRDKSVMYNPANKKLPENIMTLFNVRDSQMQSAQRDLLLQQELGDSRLARFINKLNYYHISDQWGRLRTFWGEWNHINRAVQSYQKHGDFQKFLKDSGMNELTVQQQIDLAEALVMGKQYAAGDVALGGAQAAVYEGASQMAANIHFIYNRMGRSTWEYGPEGRVLTSLLIFPRSYFEQLYLQANRVKPGSKASGAEKARAWKALIAVIVGGYLVGSIYEEAAGKTRNPYNALNVLSYSGGLAIGLSQDILKVIHLLTQWAQGEEWAASELTTAIPRLGDSFGLIYAPAINTLEALTDTRYIDRKFLRDIRAKLDLEYQPKEEYYVKERSLIGKIRHALFAGEEPDPEDIDVAREGVITFIDKLGTQDEDAKQRAIEAAKTPTQVFAAQQGDYIYTLQKLGSDIDYATKRFDLDQISEENGFHPIVTEYWYMKDLRDQYSDFIKEETAKAKLRGETTASWDEQQAYRIANPETEAALVLWQGFKTFQSDEAELIVRRFIREYGISESAIPALREVVEPATLREYRPSEYQSPSGQYGREPWE